MKTVLIVEDEKMIRQGIRTMVQRSGVPVEVIMECGNGEAALEIVKEQEIDVMFTDIRMPKMDGLELVRRIQEAEHVPFVVAISGYDDFSYAVELLRHGIREYILKPVEREKIVQILEKLDKEIESRKEKTLEERRIGKQQAKYLMLTKHIKKEEMELLEQKFEKTFFSFGYVVCAYGSKWKTEENDMIISLTDVEDSGVSILEEDNVELLLKNELRNASVGISCVHHGLSELRVSYEEAVQARERAFCSKRKTVSTLEERKKIPEGLRQKALTLIEEQSWIQRVQLLGTGKTEELIRQWELLFNEVEKERILPDEFQSGMLLFLKEMKKIYRNVITDRDDEVQKNCMHIFAFGDIEEYQEYFMGWILEIHNRINSQTDNNRNLQKIQQAVAYIRENYNKDLNMAVVSNEISMNYSLFSFLFKQYTGSNFVNYLKEIRINEAKNQLENTDKKVIEISQMIGYDNEKHFMKVFKSVCGVSPSEYRRNMTKNEII